MPRNVYCFGHYRLDVAARELHDGNERVTASPTVFDCIVYLLEHRDRAVGRDELIAAVWGKTAVTDAVLGKTILKVRRAVGDTGDEQNVVRTVPRFGFHWVADIRCETPSAPVASDDLHVGGEPAEYPSPLPSGRSNSRQIAWLATGGIGILIAGIAMWFGSGGAPATSIERSDPAGTATPAVIAQGQVAVLPVAVTAPAGDAWLRLGLMDLIARHLRDAGVGVVPSDSVVRMIKPDQVIDANALRSAMGAQWLVESSLRKSDAVWFLNLDLVDGEGVRRKVEASGNDPVGVARDSANRVLLHLGRPIAADPDAVPDLQLTELIQQLEASMLVGDVNAARRLIEAAQPEQRISPEVRLYRAQADYWSGQIDSALEQLKALSAAADVRIDPVLHARVLSNLGNSARLLGDLPAAELALDEAIALLDDQDEPVRLGQLYVARGINHAENEHYSRATDDFATARMLFQSIGNQFELTVVEYCEGFIENRRNRPLAALAIFKHVAGQFELFGATTELASARSNQVVAEHNLLRHVDALATSEHGLSLLDRLQNDIARHQILMSRAIALESVGRFAEARGLNAELAAQLGDASDANSLASVRVEQAGIELQTGNPAAAYDLIRMIGPELEDPRARVLRASAWIVTVQALIQLNRSDEALAEAGRFVDWATTGDDEVVKLYSRFAEAEAMHAAAGREAALDLYEEAMAMAERGGVPIDTVLVAVPYGNVLLAADDIQRASTVAGRVARYADQDFQSALLHVALYHRLGKTDAWQKSLEHARSLAGERSIPQALEAPPQEPAGDSGLDATP